MYNWKKTVVTADMSLMDVLAIIDKEALRIALVVDAQGGLIGTLTDGDVRRALLEHGNLQIPVIEVMNKHPITALQTMSSIELDTFIQSKNILAIPIVDENNILLGLHTLQSLQSGKIHENSVFIMAGGFGTRLKPLTDNCPKPMLKVGGKPILEIILERFLEAGFRNFYFSTHYLPEVIRDYFCDGSQYGCSIQYVHEENPLGTGGALGLLPDNLPDLPLIMMNGDVLSKVDFEHLLKYHGEQESVATMCVRKFEYQVPYGVVQGDGHRIISMVEKPKQAFFINAGIYVIDKRIIKSVPKGKKIDMPTLLESHMSNQKNISMFPIHEYWIDVGKMNDFEQAQNDYLKDFNDN